MHIFGFAWRILAAERAGIGGRGLQRRHDALDLVLSKAGTDHPDKGQVIAAIDARHQRAEFAVGGFPPSQHDLMSGAAVWSSATFSPSASTSGSALPSLAIAWNFSVQSRPFRVLSRASPSSTRNCTR